jgi:hypothetical protein
LQEPSIGRIVHYSSYGSKGGEFVPGECRAAIVTAVHDMDPCPEDGIPYIGLCVLNPNGVYFNTSRHDPEKSGGSWHWPERIET